MQHIADERLHAFVDRDRSGMDADEAGKIQAHLAECGACRLVVEDGLVYRSRAGGILARSGPPRVLVPDFEEIQARASAAAGASEVVPMTRRRPQPMRRSYVALAWAASLIAALGLGWLTRDLFTERDQVAVEMMSSETGEEARTMSADAPVGSDPAMPKAGGMADPSGAAPPVAAENQGASAGAGASSAGGAIGVAQDAAGSGGPAVGSQTIELQSAPEAAASSATARSTAPVAAAAPRPTSPEAASTPERFTRPAAPAPAPAPTSQREGVQAARGPASAAAAAAPPPAQARIAESAVADMSADLAWSTVSRRDAEARFGAPILTIPGLPIRTMEVLGSGSGAIVRVIQATAAGAVVTLTQARSGGGVMAAGAAAITRQIGGVELAIEGDLPASTLRSLLDSAR